MANLWKASSNVDESLFGYYTKYEYVLCRIMFEGRCMLKPAVVRPPTSTL